MTEFLSVVASAVLMLGTVPAHAAQLSVGFNPVRTEATSVADPTASKHVLVDCPDGLVAYAPGGKIVGGAGAVVLTGMVPSADLTSVTVSGRARTGFTGAWSITAYVMCAEPMPALTLRTAIGLGSARANCPLGTFSWGTGFETFGDPDSVFIDEVYPEVDLSSVVAHVEGLDPLGLPALVRAYAVCAQAPSGAPNATRVSVTTAYNSVSPKAVSTVPCLVYLAELWVDTCWVFGVGGLVEGSHRAFLDRLVPRDAPGTAGARAVLASPGPVLNPATPNPVALAPAALNPAALNPAALAPMDEDDDYSTTVYAVLIGSWYANPI